MALGRLLVGSLVLTGIALRRLGVGLGRGPRGRALALIIAYGVLWFGVYTIAVNAAGRYLDAGTSAMIVNLAPVIVAVLAGLFLGEGFPRRLMVGLLIAFAGVVIIASASRTGVVDPRGVSSWRWPRPACTPSACCCRSRRSPPSTRSPSPGSAALAGAVATLPFLPRAGRPAEHAAARR